jgi:hypothetical protein
MNILKQLKPYDVFSPKKRLGPPEDGGYVITENVLEGCSALFTYGVGNDIRYEEEFYSLYKKPVYLFDHTLGRDAWQKEGLSFIPQGLGFEQNCKDWYENYVELGIRGDVFLKVDVEGYEYEYFPKVDVSKMGDHVLGLILEIHWIDGESNRNKASELLEKLSSHFVICHIHGNSWAEKFEYEGFTIPNTYEISLVNKKRISEFKPDNQEYPIKGLDVSNCPHREDYSLDFLKHF